MWVIVGSVLLPAFLPCSTQRANSLSRFEYQPYLSSMASWSWYRVLGLADDVIPTVIDESLGETGILIWLLCVSISAF